MDQVLVDVRSNDVTRSVYKKGEILHQMTIGAGGKDFDEICTNSQTEANVKFAENIYYGFALVHATPEKLSIEIRGVPKEAGDNTSIVLYTLEIIRQPTTAFVN